MENTQLQSESELLAFANNWDQISVAEIPTVLIHHFAGFLELDRFAQSVPPEYRGVSWLPSGLSPQHGFQVKAVDKAGVALVERSTFWTSEDMTDRAYSTMPLAEAVENRKKYSQATLHKLNEIAITMAGDFGQRSFNTPASSDGQLNLQVFTSRPPSEAPDLSVSLSNNDEVAVKSGAEEPAMLSKNAGSWSEVPALIHMHGPTDEARVLQLEQRHLFDCWVEALHAKNPARIEVARSKYDANVQALLTHLGQDAPCNFVDSDLWSDYSDLFKSVNGYRPKHHLSRSQVQQCFANQPAKGPTSMNTPQSTDLYLGDIRTLLASYAAQLHEVDFMKIDAQKASTAVQRDWATISASDLELVHLVLFECRQRCRWDERDVPSGLEPALRAVEADALARGIQLRPKLAGPELSDLDELAYETRRLGLAKANPSDILANGERYEAYEIGWYRDLTKDDYLALQQEAQDIGEANAMGQDTPGQDARLEMIDRLMDRSPWTMHPDHGCIVETAVASRDRASSSPSA